MHLSNKAKELLKSKKIDALLALPLNELLEGFKPDQITRYGFVIDKLDVIKEEDLSKELARPGVSAATAFNNFEDPITLVTLKNPVALSNGQIVSQETADAIFQQARISGTEPKCPKTRQVITTNVVVLPQLAYALHFLQLDRITRSLQKQVAFKIVASSNKFRIFYTEDDQTHLRDFLKNVFEGAPNCLDELPPQDNYYLEYWSRGWSASRLEWHFPQGSLDDDMATRFLDQILGPLNLPVLPLDQAGIQGYKMKERGPREYITLYQSTLSYQHAGLCMIAFLLASDHYRRLHNVSIDKAVTTSGPLIHRKKDYGLGVFGPSMIPQNPPPAPSQSRAVSKTQSSALSSASGVITMVRR
jgi:hypothetical protein